MDEYDVIDFVYDAVAASIPNVLVVKDKSESGMRVEHVVINNITHVESDFTGKTPVNINIFVPLNPNGMIKRQRMKELRRTVRRSIDAISSNDGNCRQVEVLWAEKMSELKEGFDCVNIRINVLTDK
ncbi:hypothetical protein JN06_01344 [Bacteroides zoogleoformans]|uniref:Uncharacterized protein n=1 Tax=Bacteroides zoogleoformans TaxID=28119 RepID=A0ABN5IL34_9BACE|nr:hypothetical protein [Bacteroides zoogleoformans]AVM53311.1 hypothetical protein C4H11_10555 [Bacteroides zoogleoformans]TWJ14411.1 hypothetical protein JN06_01344 [Bacteroides zoogleoformans]